MGEEMRLAIADPPYPPMLKAAGGYKARASRWYGNKPRSLRDKQADFHPEASDWDDPERHRKLIDELMEFDGWALATAPDALEVYYPLPVGCRIGAWVKPNAQPGAHRLRSNWEPIVVYVPKGRRNNIGRGQISDVVTAPIRNEFRGQKPPEWTQWVLSALSYDPQLDQVVDLFRGSGAVEHAISRYQTGEWT